jgi:hypothetical protein
MVPGAISILQQVFMQQNDFVTRHSVEPLGSHRPLCVPQKDRRRIDDRRTHDRGGRRATDHRPLSSRNGQ